MEHINYAPIITEHLRREHDEFAAFITRIGTPSRRRS